MIQPNDRSFERHISRALAKLSLVVGVRQSQYFKRTKKQSASASLTEVEVSSGDFVGKASMKRSMCPVCGLKVKTQSSENAFWTMSHMPKKNFVKLIEMTGKRR